jgi:hypothetical protein
MTGTLFWYFPSVMASQTMEVTRSGQEMQKTNLHGSGYLEARRRRCLETDNVEFIERDQEWLPWQALREWR